MPEFSDKCAQALARSPSDVHKTLPEKPLDFFISSSIRPPYPAEFHALPSSFFCNPMKLLLLLHLIVLVVPVLYIRSSYFY